MNTQASPIYITSVDIDFDDMRNKNKYYALKLNYKNKKVIEILESYFQHLTNSIQSGKLDEIKYTWNEFIPKELYYHILNYKPTGDYPPVIYQAFCSSIVNNDKTILEFFLKETNIDWHIDYYSKKLELYFSNPITYYFISNNYKGNDEELNNNIMEKIEIYFESMEYRLSQRHYIRRLNIAEDLRILEIKEDFPLLIEYIRWKDYMEIDRPSYGC